MINYETLEIILTDIEKDKIEALLIYLKDNGFPAQVYTN